MTGKTGKRYHISHTDSYGTIKASSQKVTGTVSLGTAQVRQPHIFLVLGIPVLNAVLQMGPHKSGAEVNHHLPLPAGQATSSQNTQYAWIIFLPSVQTGLNLKV